MSPLPTFWQKTARTRVTPLHSDITARPGSGLLLKIWQERTRTGVTPSHSQLLHGSAMVHNNLFGNNLYPSPPPSSPPPTSPSLSPPHPIPSPSAPFPHVLLHPLQYPNPNMGKNPPSKTVEHLCWGSEQEVKEKQRDKKLLVTSSGRIVFDLFIFIFTCCW